MNSNTSETTIGMFLTHNPYVLWNLCASLFVWKVKIRVVVRAGGSGSTVTHMIKLSRQIEYPTFWICVEQRQGAEAQFTNVFSTWSQIWWKFRLVLILSQIDYLKQWFIWHNFPRLHWNSNYSKTNSVFSIKFELLATQYVQQNCFTTWHHKLQTSHTLLSTLRFHIFVHNEKVYWLYDTFYKNNIT